ncbi:hypothetical protein AMTR_s00022p00241270 [Amborella trichopoda]|uniref:Uncharacterized protein n=1 Tax=Amborella trichopoda TaxID=13333 RepID=W1PUL8_AMBTC|nr:hypothetical protein AMTR_s00022p00241270 [Amborella trichopoda]
MASQKLSVFAFLLVVVASLPASFAQESAEAPLPMENRSSFQIPALGAIVSASLLSFLTLLAH